MPTEIIISHLAKSLLGKLEESFSSAIIERWSKYRAREFFNAFVRALEEELTFNHLTEPEEMLHKILTDKTKSEILFESYRSVVLSASKELGPRIIGFLTAQLISQDRTSNEIEDKISLAAASLSDSELKNFCNFWDEIMFKINNNKEKILLEKFAIISEKDFIKICATSESQSYFGSKQHLNISPIPLNSIYGSWALKLKNLGILEEEVIEEQWDYDADTERYIDEAGTQKIVTWWLIISKDYQKFFELIKRAETIDNFK